MQNEAEYNKLKLTTIPLMAAVAISNILYTSLHAFYPLFMESRFPESSTLHFAIILGIYEVSNLIASLFLGNYMGKLKRKNLIIKSYILIFVSTLAFCFLPLL